MRCSHDVPLEQRCSKCTSEGLARVTGARPKIQAQKRENGTRSMLFECPGCDMLHVVYVESGPGANLPVWQWNGSLDKPTFSPSVLVRYPWGESREERVCHSFVRDGRIQFLDDCTHALAGKTVDLPDIEP